MFKFLVFEKKKPQKDENLLFEIVKLPFWIFKRVITVLKVF